MNHRTLPRLWCGEGWDVLYWRLWKVLWRKSAKHVVDERNPPPSSMYQTVSNPRNDDGDDDEYYNILLFWLWWWKPVTEKTPCRKTHVWMYGDICFARYVWTSLVEFWEHILLCSSPEWWRRPQTKTYLSLWINPSCKEYELGNKSTYNRGPSVPGFVEGGFLFSTMINHLWMTIWMFVDFPKYSLVRSPIDMLDKNTHDS